MKGIAIASGESLKYIKELKDVENIPAYIVNANILTALDTYPDVFGSFNIKHIANRMVPSIFPKEYYLKFNVKEIQFTVPKERDHEIIKSIEKVKSYGIKDLRYYFVPNILASLYRFYDNITFYAILRLIYIENCKDISIIGMDFWEGDYLTKKSTDHQKTIPAMKDMYFKFYDLVDKHSFVNFTSYTVSKKLKDQKNLKVIVV
jgi:hypothetical protein